MMVIKNVLKNNIDFDIVTNRLKSLNGQEVFPNYSKLFNIAITLPILLQAKDHFLQCED